MIVDAPDGSEIEFPDSMSEDEIRGVMAKKFPPPDVTKDMINSGIQGVRNVAEGLLAAPGMADDLENSVVNWLKGSGAESNLAQSLGIGNTMKTWGENYDAVKNAIGAGPEQDIAMPNYGDLQWLEKQAGLRDQYKPQTPAGNLAYGGAVAGLGGAIGGPMAGRVIANPYAQALGKGALQAAGIGAAGAGAYKLFNVFGGPR